MDVWRICKKKHAATAFDGIGAEIAGSRWNFKGHKVVYTSSTLTLAKLEVFVHLTGNTAPDDLVYIKAIIPNDVSREDINLSHLPAHWMDHPARDATKSIGSNWVERGKTLIFSVPSAITPEEHNILINPSHAEFNRITIDKPAPLRFDRRMWK
ncbi:MAG: RES family NAD+ phosphorylase [Planctomycetaceae bacterium]